MRYVITCGYGHLAKEGKWIVEVESSCLQTAQMIAMKETRRSVTHHHVVVLDVDFGDGWEDVVVASYPGD